MRSLHIFEKRVRGKRTLSKKGEGKEFLRRDIGRDVPCSPGKKKSQYRGTVERYFYYLCCEGEARPLAEAKPLFGGEN